MQTQHTGFGAWEWGAWRPHGEFQAGVGEAMGEQRLSGHSYWTWEATSQGRAIQSEKEIKGIQIEQEEVKLT